MRREFTSAAMRRLIESPACLPLPEYTDDAFMIPKNTSVTVRRVPSLRTKTLAASEEPARCELSAMPPSHARSVSQMSRRRHAVAFETRCAISRTLCPKRGLTAFLPPQARRSDAACGRPVAVPAAADHFHRLAGRRQTGSGRDCPRPAPCPGADRSWRLRRRRILLRRAGAAPVRVRGPACRACAVRPRAGRSDRDGGGPQGQLGAPARSSLSAPTPLPTPLPTCRFATDASR